MRLLSRITLTEPVLNRRIFIAGFQGIGLVGFISVRSLISALNCKRVGFVELPQEPPYTAYVFDYNKLVTPGELYHDEVNGITLFLAHWGFLERHMHLIAKMLAQWVYLNNYNVSVLFGGLDSEVRGQDTSPLRVVATKTFKRFFTLCGAKDMDLNYLVIGPLALLLNEFERLDFPAVAILPYASRWRADPLASMVGLEFFTRCFNVSIDISKLKDLIMSYERELEEARKLVEEEMRKRTSQQSPYYI